MILDKPIDVDGVSFRVRKLDEFPFDEVESARGQSLQPGDLLFLRKNMPWWQVVSQTAAYMDGFFSHVAIYVGGPRRMVVDSSLTGVKIWPFSNLATDFGVGSCVVVARPRRSKTQRTAVANWARGVARAPDDRTNVEFDTAALASAFVVLAKLRLRTAVRERLQLKAIESVHLASTRQAVTRATEEMRQFRETFDDPFETQEYPPGVCAGFVWQGYARHSERLVPALLEGSRIPAGEIFGPPNVDPSVLDLVLDDAPPDTFGGQVGSLRSAFKDLAPLLRQAKVVIPALVGTTIGNRRGTLLEMVGPGDLFCSADIDRRFYLSAVHEQTAKEWRRTWLQSREVDK